MNDKLVSICIPAYKRKDFIIRCLESVKKQVYKNIEVIISDDSPDEGIEEVTAQFQPLSIKYFHNKQPLGSPANWNKALNHASGDYILLLHQDDWLHSANAITSFINSFDDTIDFVFCRNTGMNEKNELIDFSADAKPLDLYACSERLILRNVIGPPSNVMVSKKIKARYDTQFIWLVDIDYYIAILKQNFRYKYLDLHLVTIGIHTAQTTAYVQDNKEIILKENLLLLIKLGAEILKDIKLYDHYWRLMRNFNVRSFEPLQLVDVELNTIPSAVKSMIDFQRKIPHSFLHIGAVSKSLMTLSYIRLMLLLSRSK